MKRKNIPLLMLLSTAAFTFIPLNGEEVTTVKEQSDVESTGLTNEVQVSPAEVAVQTPGLAQGKEVPYCIKYDPTKWELTKEINNPAAEFAFKKKGDAIYAFVIPERSPVPISSMPEVIVYNATSKGMKDVKVIAKEKKMIDGKEVLFIEWEGVIGDMGTKVSYLGYIFSGTEGTVQFYAFSMSNFLDMYRKDMMEILNGLCFVKSETPSS